MGCYLFYMYFQNQIIGNFDLLVVLFWPWMSVYVPVEMFQCVSEKSRLWSAGCVRLNVTDLRFRSLLIINMLTKFYDVRSSLWRDNSVLYKQMMLLLWDPVVWPDDEINTQMLSVNKSQLMDSSVQSSFKLIELFLLFLLCKTWMIDRTFLDNLSCSRHNFLNLKIQPSHWPKLQIEASTQKSINRLMYLLNYDHHYSVFCLHWQEDLLNI